MIGFDETTGCIGWEKNIDRFQVLNSFRSVEEIVLLRMDNLDAQLRIILNVSAVFGSEFTFDDLLLTVQHLTRNDGSSKESLCERIKKNLDTASNEGILVKIVHGGCESTHEQISYEIRFFHELWRSAILKTMLKSHIKDIHLSIAEALEDASLDALGDLTCNNLEFMMKLYMHWREGGNFAKAAKLALKMGKSFKSMGVSNESVGIYQELIKMWIEPGNNFISKQVLKTMNSNDVNFLILLKMTMATTLMSKSLNNAKQYVFDTFEILDNAPASANITDRSLLFQLFNEFILKSQEDMALQTMATQRFVSEAKKMNDPVHVCQALALQSVHNFRSAKLETALESHYEVEEQYEFEKHSLKISLNYGHDYVVYNFGLCTQWHDLNKNEFQLEFSIDFLFERIVPKMNQRSEDYFITLYPILWVLKNNQQTNRALNEFESFLESNFLSVLEKKNK